MRLTKEQLAALAPYERFFKQAIEARYCSFPGEVGIDLMKETWKAVTGQERHVQRGCSRCLFNLVEDIAAIYFADKAEAEAAEKAAEEKKPAETSKPSPAKKNAPKAKKSAKK